LQPCPSRRSRNPKQRRSLRRGFMSQYATRSNGAP